MCSLKSSAETYRRVNLNHLNCPSLESFDLFLWGILNRRYDNLVGQYQKKKTDEMIDLICRIKSAVNYWKPPRVEIQEMKYWNKLDSSCLWFSFVSSAG